MNETNGYLIRGGEIHSGGNEPYIADVLLRNGVIEAIDQNLPDGGVPVIDATGLIVAPGLIDLHAHVYSEMGIFSIDPSQVGIRTGVTTLLDTGSAGALTYGPFHRFVIPQAEEEVFVLLNISAIGVQGHPGKTPCMGDLTDGRWAHVPWAVDCIRAHRDRIIGTKVRMTAALADFKVEHEEAGLKGVIEAAMQTDTFAMIHHVASNVPLQRVLSAMRSGDVLTHVYHPHADGSFDSQTGAPLPATLEARDRGIVYDVGHGVGSFAWSVAEPACQQHNFWPDTISTDIHQFNLDGPVYDMATTMNKFLYMGMPLPKVIEATTATPAKVMGMADRIGHVKVNHQADLVLLRLVNESVTLTDVSGETRTAGKRLAPVKVFKRGRLTDLE